MFDEQFLEKMLSVFDEAETVDVEVFEKKSFNVSGDKFVRHFVHLRDEGIITTDREESKHNLGLRFSTTGGKTRIPNWTVIPLYRT